MTPKERAAIQQALEALETLDFGDSYKTHNAASALREALAEQAEQEPVAWVDPTEEQIMAQTGYVDMNHDDLRDFYLVVKLCNQLNSAPVRTKDLTPDELFSIANKVGFDGELMKTNHDRGMPSIAEQYARAVIAADREKNK